MSTSELACTYACLILNGDGIPTTVEKITTPVMVANVSVESYWPGLYAKLLERRSVEDLITNNFVCQDLNVSNPMVISRTNSCETGGGAAVTVSSPATSAAAGAPAAEMKEEKKEEVKEESDDDMGFSLFD